MNLDINKAIEQIAEKLGIAVNEIYPVLYKQTIIDAVKNGMWVLIFTGVIVAFVLGIRFIAKKQKEEEYGYDWDWDEPRQVVFSMIGGALTLIALIAIPLNISNGITAIFNPDFYIMDWVLSKIGGS